LKISIQKVLLEKTKEISHVDKRTTSLEEIQKEILGKHHFLNSLNLKLCEIIRNVFLKEECRIEGSTTLEEE
jgi:hypothetical protein